MENQQRTLRAGTIDCMDNRFQVKLEYDYHVLFHQMEYIQISERLKQAATAAEKFNSNTNRLTRIIKVLTNLLSWK